jgi:CHASE2 domain-containing sensor protein
VPTDADLAKSVVDYKDLFSADGHRLRDWFSGKVVVLADLRRGKDGPFPYPDGRLLPGAFLHSSAIEQLLERENIQRTMPIRLGSGYVDAWYIIVCVAGMLGVVAGLAWVHHWPLLRAAALVAAPVGVAGFIAAFRLQGVLLSPLVPLFAFVMVAGLVVWSARLRRPLV